MNMSSGDKTSSTDIFLRGLEIIWNPGVEGLKLRQKMNVGSLKDISIAAERAGYEVCCVDLPENVSGFAVLIAGKPYIAVNRAKSPQHRLYTIAHELGHQILHLDTAQDPNQDLAEFQAHMFAASLVLGTTNDDEREDVVKQNPESLLVPAVAIFMTLVIAVILLLVYLQSRLFPAQLPSSTKTE